MMKLIEADKVEQAIKDYWKAQVDRLPIPKSIEEHDAYANRLGTILEYNDGLLKAIDELPSAEPDTTTHDSIPAETGKNDGDGASGDCISRQRAVDTLRKMQTYKLFAGDDMILIDKAQVQTELMMLPSAQPEPRTAYWTKDIVGSVVCSYCGGIREDNRIGHTQWCNCCGCFMRGEEE